MPLYFAYGSNMDVDAMRSRCPKGRAVGPARLARHRYVLMGRTGYASVQRCPSETVHGLLFDLALSDVAPLDRYEDVAHGLYIKMVQPVVLSGGGGAREALIYVGTDDTVGGTPPSGYMEGVIAAARAAALPAAYVARLAAMVPRATGMTPSRGRRTGA